MAKILLALLAVSSVIALAYSHGMLLDPVARGSRWRYDTTAPSNFEDNELFCGGFTVSGYFFLILSASKINEFFSKNLLDTIYTKWWKMWIMR